MQASAPSSEQDQLRAILSNARNYQEAFAAASVAMRLPGAQRVPAANAKWMAAVGKLVAAADLQSSALTRQIAGIDPYVGEMTKIGRVAKN